MYVEGLEESKILGECQEMMEEISNFAPDSEEDIKKSKETFEMLLKSLLQKVAGPIEPCQIDSTTDYRVSYLGYPPEVLQILREKEIDKNKARTLIHHIKDLKPAIGTLPSIAVELKSQAYLPASIIEEFIEGHKIKAQVEARGKDWRFLIGKKTTERQALLPEIILYARSDKFCETNKKIFSHKIYPCDVNSTTGTPKKTLSGGYLVSLGNETTKMYNEWLKSERRAIQAKVALSTNLIFIALGYPTTREEGIARSQYTYKRVTVHQADLESISGLSVHAETSSVKSVPAKDQLFFEKNEPKQMQMQSSSIIEPSSKKRSLPKLKHSASDKPAQPLSLNLPRAEVSTLLQKHISKSRLQELIEEVQGLYTVEKQVKAHAEEDLRKKRLGDIDFQEAELKARLNEVSTRRLTEQSRPLENEPEIARLSLPLKKVKKLTEEEFKQLPELMERAKYEEVIGKLDQNQTHAQLMETQINELKSKINKLNQESEELRQAFSGTEFFGLLHEMEQYRQCFSCYSTEGYKVLVFNTECSHRLCEKCANIDLNQIVAKDYAESLIGNQYLCLLCGTDVIRKIEGVGLKK